MKHILNRWSSKPRASTASDRSPTAKTEVPLKAKLKGIVRKIAIATISTALTVSILLAADLYLHHKHEVNLWGYRGPAAGRKQPSEKRIAVLGGSTAWGFGLAAGQAFPSQLQQRFAERARNESSPTISVLNLAFNNEGAYSFKYTLRDYEYLEYDAVLLYSGYNDLASKNQIVFRHRSPIFDWTGYLPLLPAFTVDKITAWSRRADGKNPIVFAPPNADESERREQTSNSLEKSLGQLTESARLDSTASQGDCPAEWQFYCQQIYEATDSALRQGKRVLIVTEPYISDKHVDQQRALEGMLTRRFAGQANYRYLNLGRTVDLRDHSLCWDGMHLTPEGNRRVAEALTQPVLELLGAKGPKP